MKAYNCVRLKPRQHTQVCTPIQTDLLKPGYRTSSLHFLEYADYKTEYLFSST